MKLKNGHTYSGQYFNNKRHGCGVYQNGESNDTYKGQFVNNKRQGYGVYNYYKSATYSGCWKNNVKEGYGVLKYEDGIIIKGIFANGDITSGEIHFPNDSTYSGSISSFLMNGQGTLIYSDGFQIYGEFYQDDLILNNKKVCCYCLQGDCDDQCYENYEGICGNPDVFKDNLFKEESIIGPGCMSNSTMEII